jgi:hypothetical protein
MATHTSTQVAKLAPKSYHVGVQAAFGKQVFTAAAADVLKLAKIPNNATVLGGFVQTPNDSFNIAVGDDQVADRYLAAVQNSAVTKFDFSAVAGTVYKIALSDDAAQFTHLNATITSASSTGTVHWCVFYTMDG